MTGMEHRKLGSQGLTVSQIGLGCMGMNPINGRPVNLGGSAQGNAESSLDAIGKVIAFLRQSLPATATP